jgi:hyperosmotically inducible protein
MSTSRMQRFVLLMIVGLAGALCNGCRTSGQQVDDSAITKAVKAKLAAQFGPGEARQERQEERGAKLQTISEISVHSVNGVVTLTGEVNSARAKAKAGEIARNVKQVAGVNNNLAVAPQYSDDAVGEK